MIEFNTRKEDPSLTSGFQRRNFKRNCPVEQGSYVTDRTKTGKGVNATESLLLEKDRKPPCNHQSFVYLMAYFGQCIFKINQKTPFHSRQSILVTNNHLLETIYTSSARRAYVMFATKNDKSSVIYFQTAV